MLVEINLLPEKEPKKYSIFIFAAGLLVLFLLIGCYYYLQISTTKTSIESVDRQISAIKKIEEKNIKKVATIETNNSVSQLKAAVNWAKTYPIETVPVMQQLTSLLPERGFIQSFTYSDSGDIAISVQFDSSSDAAYFLDNLNSAKWIEDASLTSLNTVSNPTETGTDSTANSNNQPSNNSSSTNTTQETSGSQTTTEGQSKPSSTGTTPNSGSATPSANNGTKPGNIGKSSSNVVNNNVLPRYLGQFNITLNKEAIKSLMNQGQNDGAVAQGVKGS
jgi:Tfp pilus assembly protein PilN